MKVFFDSSSYAKRFLDEAGSQEVESLCQQADSLGLSILCYPEILIFSQPPFEGRKHHFGRLSLCKKPTEGRVGGCRNPPHHARGDGTGRKAFRNKRTSGAGCFANRLRPEMETGPVCDCRSPTSQGRRQGWAFYKNSVNAVCHRESRSKAVWPIQQPNTSRVVERARSAYHALRWALGILRLGGSSSPKLAFIG